MLTILGADVIEGSKMVLKKVLHVKLIGDRAKLWEVWEKPREINILKELQ